MTGWGVGMAGRGAGAMGGWWWCERSGRETGLVVRGVGDRGVKRPVVVVCGVPPLT